MYLMSILEPTFDSCKQSVMYGLLRASLLNKLLLQDEIFQ
jgi:hypothetical protein